MEWLVPCTLGGASHYPVDGSFNLWGFNSPPLEAGCFIRVALTSIPLWPFRLIGQLDCLIEYHPIPAV